MVDDAEPVRRTEMPASALADDDDTVPEMVTVMALAVAVTGCSPEAPAVHEAKARADAAHPRRGASPRVVHLGRFVLGSGSEPTTASVPIMSGLTFMAGIV